MFNTQNKGGQEGKGRSFKNLKFNFPEKGFRPGLKAELKQQSTGMVSVKPLNKTSPEGERTMKRKTVFAILLLVGALVLTGWGCQKRVSPTLEDTNVETEIPADWKEYKNEEWGVNFRYPPDWLFHEYQETIEGEEVLTLAFSDESLPEILPPEPLFPIMIFRDTRTVEEISAIHADAISTENFTLGERIVRVVTRYSDILEQNYRIYLVPLRAGSMQFLPLDTRYISVAENMINTVIETE